MNQYQNPRGAAAGGAVLRATTGAGPDSAPDPKVTSNLVDRR
jgi:hypothetical protein